MIRQQTEVNSNEERSIKTTSTVFKSDQWDQNIGSNLILTGFLKISRVEIMIFTKSIFKDMFLVKMINTSQYFLL